MSQLGVPARTSGIGGTYDARCEPAPRPLSAQLCCDGLRRVCVGVVGDDHHPGEQRIARTRPRYTSKTDCDQALSAALADFKSSPGQVVRKDAKYQEEEDTMTSTLRRTSSAAKPGNLSNFPSAKRYSMARSFPSM